MIVAPVVSVIVLVLGPLSGAVNWVVRHMLSAFGVKLSSGDILVEAHEEIRGAVDLLHREGSVIKDDRDRLGGVLDLGDLEVSDVMVHRTSIRMLNADDPAEVTVRAILDSPIRACRSGAGPATISWALFMPRMCCARWPMPTMIRPGSMWPRSR